MKRPQATETRYTSAMRWLARSAVVSFLSLSVGGLGCSDEALQSASSSTGAGGAAGAGGSGGSPAQPPGEAQPLAVPEWMVTEVGASNDPVVSAMIAGTFDLPPAGDYLGLNWWPVAPGEDGKLVDTNDDRLYAAARIQVPDGHHVFARGDTVISFYTDSLARHPGDFYHSKKMRVPLAAHGGEHLIVVRAMGKRNTPEVELWSTDAEIVFNAADVTKPDLIVGDSSERPFGIAVLNITAEAIADVSARVVESDHFEATEIRFPSLAPDATTQLSFLLRPKAPPAEGVRELSATLRIDSPELDWDYEEEVIVPVVQAGARYRHTRRSQVDASTQYHAVVPPVAVENGKTYGLFLSLHGAGVEAKGQAASYGHMDWAYVVAATNRRPFGFDWEEWGRLDAVEALDTAIASYPIDPNRVHLTGHSMGGHGSWHNGVHFGHRFGVVAPSAGWIAFDQYGGGPFPSGVIGRARAASMTLDFVDNFSNNVVYIIHGSADTNVPISHAKQMNTVLTPIVSDLTFHTEPGAGHWWDNDPDEPGADCVDFQPMIDKAEATILDPVPLDFTFTTPGSWVSSTRSFATVSSCASPMDNCSVSSVATGTDVAVTTSNVRTLYIDGDALKSKQVGSLTVDGQSHAIVDGSIRIGPEGGKVPSLHGPLNQVFHRPFCFVWSDDGPPAYRHYAAWLLSWWSVIGNGHGCGLPLSGLTDDLRENYNLVFLGVPLDAVDKASDLPIGWTDEAITVGAKSFNQAAVAFVYPRGERLFGYWAAAAGHEHLIFRYTPFSSRAGMPDYLVFDTDGVAATGFFDADWKLASAYAEGL